MSTTVSTRDPLAPSTLGALGLLGPRSRGEPDVAEGIGGVTHVGPV